MQRLFGRRNNGKRRAQQRYRVYAFIVWYARENNGTPPRLADIARHFDVVLNTARGHVMELVNIGVLEWRNSQIIVVNAEWTPPPEADALTAGSDF